MIEIEKSIEAKAARRPTKATQGFPEPDDTAPVPSTIKQRTIVMNEKSNEAFEAIDRQVDRWPAEWVARKEIGRFSGGLLSPKTMANEDSKGTGPAGRFLLFNQTAYLVRPLADWMKTRSAKSWKMRKNA